MKHFDYQDCPKCGFGGYFIPTYQKETNTILGRCKRCGFEKEFLPVCHHKEVERDICLECGHKFDFSGTTE
jgi:DNA-directed RNA polymerase subunit M/transcription elongation factor TFIIS